MTPRQTLLKQMSFENEIPRKTLYQTFLTLVAIRSLNLGLADGQTVFNKVL